MLRMTIDHAGGSLEVFTDRAGALGDIAGALAAADRDGIDCAGQTVDLVDRDGQTHHLDLSAIDRVDLTWEPAPDRTTTRHHPECQR